MKEIQYYLYIIIIAFSLQNCEESISNQSIRDSQINQSLENDDILENNEFIEYLKLPIGTNVNQIDDSTIEFTLPRGIEMWGIKDFVLMSSGGSGTYTCTCSTGSGGCDVIYHKGRFGCVHGDCTGDCVGSKGGSSSLANNFIDNDNTAYYIVDLDKKLKPSSSDKSDLDFMPEDVLLTTQVKEELLNYAKFLYGDDNYLRALDLVNNSSNNESNFNDIVYIQMEMYGFKLVYGIAVDFLTKDNLRNNSFDIVLAAHHCGCKSGDSGCDKGSSMGVKYCEGNGCSKCTMTVDK